MPAPQPTMIASQPMMAMPIQSRNGMMVMPIQSRSPMQTVVSMQPTTAMPRPMTAVVQSRVMAPQHATVAAAPAKSGKTVLQPMLIGGPSARDQVAFVTGGNTGIGKEVARKLASVGMKIVLGCQDMGVGAEAARELQATSPDVAFTHLELRDKASIEAARDFIIRELGRLDVLVNCAAICYNDPTLYGKCEYTPFEKQAGITVATNFFGTLDVIRAMLPLLRASPSPRIVTISSSAGRLAILKSQDKVAAFTSPTLQVDQIEILMRQFVADVEAGVHARNGWGHTCYGMSKLGLIALTRVLARDEPRVMINCADPGYCATEMNAYHGYDPPEKGAHTAALLALLQDDQRESGKIWWKEAEHTW